MKLFFISWYLKIRMVLYNIIFNLNYLYKILTLELDKTVVLKHLFHNLFLRRFITYIIQVITEIHMSYNHQ